VYQKPRTKSFPEGTPIVSDITAKTLLERPDLLFGEYACVKCSWEGSGNNLKKVQILTNDDKVPLYGKLVCPICMSPSFFQIDNYNYVSPKINLDIHQSDAVYGMLGLIVVIILIVLIAYFFM